MDERRIKVDFSNSVAKQWNEHRRNKLRDEARKALESEVKENKVYKVSQREQTTYNSRAKYSSDRRKRSRSPIRSRDRDYDRYSRKQRSRSPRRRDDH